jgi:hypothetical protein
MAFNAGQGGMIGRSSRHELKDRVRILPATAVCHDASSLLPDARTSAVMLGLDPSIS